MDISPIQLGGSGTVDLDHATLANLLEGEKGTLHAGTVPLFPASLAYPGRDSNPHQGNPLEGTLTGF